MVRLLKFIPALKAIVPPEAGDPEFDMKLHDHRYALSASVFLLIVFAVLSYAAAFLPWSPLKLALAEDVGFTEQQMERLKVDLDARIERVENKLERVERTVIESGLRSRLDQLIKDVRSIEDATFNVERAIQQRSEEDRPSDPIYIERLDQLTEDLDRAQRRLQAFQEEHSSLIRRWTLEGGL